MPAFADCFQSGGAVEVAGEEIVGCAVTAEIHEVHSFGKRAGETVELEKEATSGFAEHIHKRFHLGQGYRTQETTQLIHPSDQASWSLEDPLA